MKRKILIGSSQNIKEEKKAWPVLRGKQRSIMKAPQSSTRDYTGYVIRARCRLRNKRKLLKPAHFTVTKTT